MAHAVTELRRVVAMIEIVLSTHILSLRMEWSMKNKFPYYILFPEIHTYFEITANQTPFLVRAVWTFVYMGCRAGIPSSIILKHVNYCIGRDILCVLISAIYAGIL